MASLPQGVPYIDLLGPQDGAEDLQTRIDLLAGPGWRVIPDDGTFESGPVPMQPLRGGLGRMWIVRGQPFHPSESFQGVAGIAIEAAGHMQASVAAAGVSGFYSWGVVILEDPRWLYGLALLDWLLNPRLAEDGSLLETEDPAILEAAFLGKSRAFAELFTIDKALSAASRLPPGSLQSVGSYQALALLGPGGSFDPRLWQMLAMELSLPQVQARAGIKPPPGAPFVPPHEVGQAAQQKENASSATESSQGHAPAAARPEVSEASSPSQSAIVSGSGGSSALSGSEPGLVAAGSGAGVDDGLTPLARAQRDAELRRAEAAAVTLEDGEGADAVPKVASEPESGQEADGPILAWIAAEIGTVLWVPPERYDPDLIRALRDGKSAGLSGEDCPRQDEWEAWLDSGAHFATEVPFLSRLFHDNVPLHRGRFDELSLESGDPPSLLCHLPRVSRVRAVPGEGGVVVSSLLDLSATAIRSLRPSA